MYYLVSPTLVGVFVVLRDVMQVMCDVWLQSTGAGEEPSDQVEQPPAEGTAGPAETTHNDKTIKVKVCSAVNSTVTNMQCGTGD